METINPTEFGRFLSAERKAKGLTQRELAERIGVTDKALSKWERGICLPEVSRFGDLAAALDLSELEILKGRRLPEEPPPEYGDPILTRSGIRRLAAGWAWIALTGFALDLLEQAGVLRVIGLAELVKFCAAAWGVWCGLRSGPVVVTAKGAAGYALSAAAVFAVVRDPFRFWHTEMNLLHLLFRRPSLELEEAFREICRTDTWTPPVIAGKFLVCVVLNEWVICGLLLCVGLYVLVRLIRALRKHVHFSTTKP